MNSSARRMRQISWERKWGNWRKTFGEWKRISPRRQSGGWSKVYNSRPESRPRPQKDHSKALTRGRRAADTLPQHRSRERWRDWSSSSGRRRTHRWGWLAALSRRDWRGTRRKTESSSTRSSCRSTTCRCTRRTRTCSASWRSCPLSWRAGRSSAWRGTTAQGSKRTRTLSQQRFRIKVNSALDFFSPPYIFMIS